MGSFEGKRALVTGASQGIGRKIAQRLLDEGARVVGTFNTSASEAEEMRAAGCEMLRADFSTREGTETFANTVATPGFDYMVNNAGIVEFEAWKRFGMDSWDRTLEVNLNAPLILILRFWPTMRTGGAIVNVASTDGWTGSFGSIAYSASKAALINLTKSLGNVLGEQGLRVNGVAPGWVDTEMATGPSLDAVSQTPLGRNGTPKDIAEAVLFLLSPAAAFVNGTTLVVDGGYTNVDSIMKQENDELEAEA